VVTIEDAINRAKEAGLDLVEVSPGTAPPVCRVMDYGKWLYEQKRKQKLNQKKQHVVTLKEIRIRPKTDTHDIEIKVKHATEFLEKGHKVQFTLMFRGREMMHIEHGQGVMKGILTTLEPLAKVERDIQMLGRRMTVVLGPK
jgi:translation initiation factor IF-3